jgi:hypothetical protein
VLTGGVAAAGVVVALLLLLRLARRLAARERELAALGAELRAFTTASIGMGQRLLALDAAAAPMPARPASAATGGRGGAATTGPVIGQAAGVVAADGTARARPVAAASHGGARDAIVVPADAVAEAELSLVERRLLQRVRAVR